MKLVRLSWDFFFGALLIGGAPVSVIALTVVLGDLYQSVFHVIIPEGASLVVFCAMSLAAVAAFACAVRYRLRRRLLPKGVVVLEVLVGVIGAVVLYAFYGVLLYSTIG
jgi:hypothetical protein